MSNSKSFTKNKYGIPIVMCCASCQYNLGASSDTTRICNKGEGMVKPTSLCSQWIMRPALDNAGRGDGHIKKPHYIQYVKKRLDEIHRMDADVKIKIELIKGINKEYMEKYGSRYIE